MIKLNLTTQNKQEELVKAYLEQNASSSLADKINNGTPFQKDGKTLINKKTLSSFMKYALEEARKLAEKGASGTYVDDPTVYGWAIHYFEEDGIEGTLYNADGSEYKPTPKPVQTPPVVTKPEKPKNEQRSLFEMMSEQENDEEEPTEEVSEDKKQEPDEEVEQVPVRTETPVPAKPKGNSLYRQYTELENRYPDCVIAYRLGDFYEILGQNAVNVAKDLDLTLTGRDCGLDSRVPMVGFPYHVSDNYISKLIGKGYKVAVAESAGNVSLKQRELQVDEETGEILSDDERDEELLMQNYNKESLIKLLELFGKDATIG